MYEHNLNPVAFSFFNLKIYWYSLAYIFGFLFSFWYSKYLVKNKVIMLDIKIVDDLITLAIIAVILGGRFGYVIFYNLSYYLENPFEIIKLWKGGMSFHGAIIGLIILLVTFSVRKKQSFNELANLIAYCSPVGIFLGRIANFINGELIGRPTNEQWGVLYNFADSVRHPSQIYEAVLEGLLIFIILFILSKNKINKAINAFAVFLILYSLFRFFLEYFREPDAQVGFVISTLSMGQILSIPMFLVGITFLKNGKK
ncbi:MAG: prolipoprotein diacylglyceryl transferase [Rickettsiales bacterium]|nr:prolipoprotein diacylglyceryl transferase [Rickettsiales bacterium]